MNDHGVRVEAYAGYKGEETPRAFVYEGMKRAIVEVAVRWYTETHCCFRVIADDGGRYVIRYAFDEEKWELVMQEQSQKREITSLYNAE